MPTFIIQDHLTAGRINAEWVCRWRGTQEQIFKNAIANNSIAFIRHTVKGKQT